MSNTHLYTVPIRINLLKEYNLNMENKMKSKLLPLKKWKKYSQKAKLSMLLLLSCIFIYFYYISKNKNNRNYNSIENNAWINNLIEKEINSPIANPPASLTRCNYKNKIVYYLPPRCCDIPSKLYNEKGDVICSPDGGFIGKGDGRCNDFFKKRTNCEIIWQDTRIE